MNHQARVTSIETVQRFRNALCEFGKEVQDSLCGVEMQIRRLADWLGDQGRYWKQQIKVRQEELTRAKIELTSRKYAAQGGKSPGTTDQEKAFRKAQWRLDEAEGKLAACRRWKPLFEHAVREYQGPARQLSTAADIELQHAVALLDQKLAALHSYLELAVPSTAGMASAVTAGAETTLPAGPLKAAAASPPETADTPLEATGDPEPTGREGSGDREQSEEQA
jgi:hypothetical protein